MDWFKRKSERNPPYWMGKSMVSCRFSLKPIHWDLYLQDSELGVAGVACHRQIDTTWRSKYKAVCRSADSLGVGADQRPASGGTAEEMELHSAPRRYGCWTSTLQSSGAFLRFGMVSLAQDIQKTNLGNGKFLLVKQKPLSGAAMNFAKQHLRRPDAGRAWTWQAETKVTCVDLLGKKTCAPVCMYICRIDRIRWDKIRQDQVSL